MRQSVKVLCAVCLCKVWRGWIMRKAGAGVGYYTKY